MTEAGKGVAAMVTACTIWGLSALFYKLLDHIPPLEVLAHRTLWSLVFFAGVLLLQRRLRELPGVLAAPRQALLLAFGAMMITVNWFCFINSVQIGRAVEASLGYYIFPLASVLLGAIFFRERLGRAQLAAVALAALAVVLLTYGLGVAPWISLLIATTFGLYGVAKKTLTIGPVVSVTAEVAVLAPVAIGFLYYVHSGGAGHYGASAYDSALLMASGPLTATPLILFSYATRRLMLASIGLLQYINPTFQFLVAVLVLGEVFSLWHAIAFGLIWVALAIYSTAVWRQDRAARRAAPKF